MYEATLLLDRGDGKGGVGKLLLSNTILGGRAGVRTIGTGGGGGDSSSLDVGFFFAANLIA